MSFNRQGMAFTYEILGFFHQDIDDVLDWMRCPSDVNNRLWAGLDEIDSMSAMSTGMDCKDI